MGADAFRRNWRAFGSSSSFPSVEVGRANVRALRLNEQLARWTARCGRS